MWKWTASVCDDQCHESSARHGVGGQGRIGMGLLGGGIGAINSIAAGKADHVRRGVHATSILAMLVGGGSVFAAKTADGKTLVWTGLIAFAAAIFSSMRMVFDGAENRTDTTH